MEQNCGNCRFFLSSEDGGVCRRYPPTIVMEKTEVGYNPENYKEYYEVLPISYFPRVDGGDWCGAWQLDRHDEVVNDYSDK